MLRFPTSIILGKKEPHPKKGNWQLRLGLAEGVGMVTVTITFSHKMFVELTVTLDVTKAALQLVMEGNSIGLKAGVSGLVFSDN